MTTDVTTCIDQIDPARLEYDDWLKVGAAIKHEGGTVEMWDTWSRRDPRYREGDCSRRWAQLDHGSAPVTVATLVKLCKEQGGTPPRTEIDHSRDFEPIPMDAPIEYADVVKPIVRREWLDVEPLPPESGKSGTAELAEYIRALFQAEEYVGFVSDAYQSEPDTSGNRKWLPGGKGCWSYTAGELLERLAKAEDDLGSVVGDWEPECGAWIRFNPLSGKGVLDRDVTDYRYALVESDEIPVDEQWSIIRKLELPCAAVVHSGGKSLHAIVHIDAADYTEYQHRVDLLYDICRRNGLAIDRKNRNPSRLSRMPGVTRNGVRQRLIGTNIGRTGWADWIDWIDALNDDLPAVESVTFEDLPELAPCLIDGVLRKGHKMLVSGPSKAGKSYLLMELALAITTGSTWLGWPCARGRVLYVNLELDDASCLHRFKDIADTTGMHPARGDLDVWNLRGKAMPMDKLAPRLIRRAQKRGYAAVIIDPIYKVITGDENSADQMAKFCNEFDRVCNELSCSVIYCHHHSKGSQGQKQAQDRASGSGVFARDPDALIDLTPLQIDDKRREQILYKHKVLALQAYLDRVKPDWRQAADMEDCEKLEYVIEAARKAGPDADKINADAHARASAMTGWRIGGILREFPAFDDRHCFFDWPLHRTGALAEELLADCLAVGELPPPLTPKERAEIGRETAARRKADTIAETRMAFEALDDGQAVTTMRLAEYLMIDTSTVGKRMRKAGYEQQKGAKGVWIEVQ